MNKSVLLLLGLQIFLLITAFSSADAAALVTGDEQKRQTLDVETIKDVRRQRAKRQKPWCAQFIGGCSLIESATSKPKTDESS